MVKIPDFNNENELRDYLIKSTLEIVVNLKDIALKKGNVRKAPINNSKMTQYKTALESIKVLNGLIKDKQLNILVSKIDNLEKNLQGYNGNMEFSEDVDFFELSEDVKKELEKFESIRGDI